MVHNAFDNDWTKFTLAESHRREVRSPVKKIDVVAAVLLVVGGLGIQRRWLVPVRVARA